MTPRCFGTHHFRARAISTRPPVLPWSCLCYAPQASASTLSGAGNYVFTNVKTGQQLSFSRSSDTTDFYPVDADEGESLAVQVRAQLCLSCSPTLFLECTRAEHLSRVRAEHR